MYIAIAGKILELQGKEVTIEDYQTGFDVTCTFAGDDSINRKVGDEGIFLGTYTRGKFFISSFDMQKFLDPLYEKQAVELAAAYNLILPIDDPFPEIFNKYQDEQTK